MTEVVRLTGVRELQKALIRLPKEIRKRELKRALRAGGRPMLAWAKALAPIGEESFIRKTRGKVVGHTRGTLVTSIVMRAESNRLLRDAARIRIGVAVDYRDPASAWYWRFIEFGTSKMQAQPFLVPAFEMTKHSANRIIIKELKKGIERQARRVSR